MCLLVAAPTVVVSMVGGGVLASVVEPDTAPLEGDDWVGWGTFLAGLVIVTHLVPLQAAAEEYVFRGWLLQATGGFFRSPWPAVVPQALLFAAGHGWGTPWGFANLAVFGVLAGWLTIRTGGLEGGHRIAHPDECDLDECRRILHRRARIRRDRRGSAVVHGPVRHGYVRRLRRRNPPPRPPPQSPHPS